MQLTSFANAACLPETQLAGAEMRAMPNRFCLDNPNPFAHADVCSALTAQASFAFSQEQASDIGTWGVSKSYRL